MTEVIVYLVPEAVDFDNLTRLRRHAEKQVDALTEGQTLQVKLTSSSHNGSAAVALMIALYRRAHVAERSVSFVEVPEEVINIIDVSGLSDMLPVVLAAEAGPPATQNVQNT